MAVKASPHRDTKCWQHSSTCCQHFVEKHQHVSGYMLPAMLRVHTKISRVVNMDIAAAASAAFIIISTHSKKRKRRWWQREFLKNGRIYGDNLMSELKINDGSHFRNFLRLTTSDFEKVLIFIAPKIVKKDTHYRAAIPPSIRLAVTLRYLATGDSYTSLMYLFKISKQVISEIVPEVCEAIIEALQEYCEMPSSEEDWFQIANAFYLKWNFPNCIGAVDGKHVQIEAPKNSGSIYFNYHGTFSVVLMAIADADYRIIYADVGCQGRISDGGVFRSTQFYKKLTQNELLLPRPTRLSQDNQTKIPYVLVGDDAFALTEYLMKPFPGTYPKGSLERAFNYRLSRARRIIENVFGLLATVFRVFRKPIPLHPKKVETLVLACISLHNFLRRDSLARRTYTPAGTFDCEDIDTGEVIPGSWRSEYEGGLLELTRNSIKSSNIAKKIRQEFGKFFMSEEGIVPWQHNFA